MPLKRSRLRDLIRWNWPESASALDPLASCSQTLCSCTTGVRWTVAGFGGAAEATCTGCDWAAGEGGGCTMESSPDRWSVLTLPATAIVEGVAAGALL